MGVLSDQRLLDLHLDADQLGRRTLNVTGGTRLFFFFSPVLSPPQTHLHLLFQLVEELSIRRLSRDAGGTLGGQNGSGDVLQTLLQRDLRAAIRSDDDKRPFYYRVSTSRAIRESSRECIYNKRGGVPHPNLCMSARRARTWAALPKLRFFS